MNGIPETVILTSLVFRKAVTSVPLFDFRVCGLMHLVMYFVVLVNFQFQNKILIKKAVVTELAGTPRNFLD